MNNLEIRNLAKSVNVKNWQIAKELGISEFTLSRHLREELDDSNKKRIIEIINELSKREEN